MKKNKLFKTLFAIIALYPMTSYGMQVIQASPQSQARAQAGRETGQAIGNSISLACERRSKAKAAEKQRIVETRNMIYIYEMFRDYDPDNHDEFISCIQRSALPEDQKMLVIAEFKDRLIKWNKDKENPT